jgi:hypothetical protein
MIGVGKSASFKTGSPAPVVSGIFEIRIKWHRLHEDLLPGFCGTAERFDRIFYFLHAAEPRGENKIMQKPFPCF